MSYWDQMVLKETKRTNDLLKQMLDEMKKSNNEQGLSKESK